MSEILPAKKLNYLNNFLLIFKKVEIFYSSTSKLKIHIYVKSYQFPPHASGSLKKYENNPQFKFNLFIFQFF